MHGNRIHQLLDRGYLCGGHRGESEKEWVGSWGVSVVVSFFNKKKVEELPVM